MNAVLEPVKLEILSGRALAGGAEVVLSGAQRLLVCALARCRHPIAREALEALVWPDDDAPRARNLFNIAVHRLRKRLGDGAIVQSADGYRFGAAVVVDLWEVEALAARLRACGPPQPPLLEGWLSIARRVCCGCARSSADPEFVASLDRRMQTAVRDVADRLARHALAAHDPDVALALAAVILEFDACDESARELAIRAHLERGDRAGAIREYRDYGRVLDEELGLAPSFALGSLVA